MYAHAGAEASEKRVPTLSHSVPVIAYSGERSDETKATCSFKCSKIPNARKMGHNTEMKSMDTRTGGKPYELK